MDEDIRELERASLASPGDHALGLRFARALERRGDRAAALVELVRLSLRGESEAAAVVATPEMLRTALEAIARAHDAELLAPATEAAIVAIEAREKLRVPALLRRLYRVSNGIKGREFPGFHLVPVEQAAAGPEGARSVEFWRWQHGVVGVSKDGTVYEISQPEDELEPVVARSFDEWFHATLARAVTGREAPRGERLARPEGVMDALPVLPASPPTREEVELFARVARSLASWTPIVPPPTVEGTTVQVAFRRAGIFSIDALAVIPFARDQGTPRVFVRTIKERLGAALAPDRRRRRVRLEVVLVGRGIGGVETAEGLAAWLDEGPGVRLVNAHLVDLAAGRTVSARRGAIARALSP
jgi:hypothetical protein